METADITLQVLETAQDLVQLRGYHGFSLDDIAERLGIPTADVHAHFESKTALGVALMGLYEESLTGILAEFAGREGGQREKLAYYINLYRQTENNSAICACGSLAADFTTLAGRLQDRIQEYFENTEKWIAETIQVGLDSQEFELVGSVDEATADLLSALQGGLILSRARSGGSVIDSVESVFMSRLSPA
ncbi:MAG: TetR/AcrR family transcriptional repressor of nem operon [Candidatus Krumholzibacteriia bacterium]|jgi:TetR/AcrR family transcriptional repressor of nem operon